MKYYVQGRRCQSRPTALINALSLVAVGFQGEHFDVLDLNILVFFLSSGILQNERDFPNPGSSAHAGGVHVISALR